MIDTAMGLLGPYALQGTNLILTYYMCFITSQSYY